MTPHTLTASSTPTAGLGRWWLMLLLFAVFGMAKAQSADAELAEYQIKAAFLCKFGHYVDWPGAAGASASQPLPFVIGVMAASGVADELALAARGQLIQGRPLLVRRIERAADAADGPSIIFIARSHMARAGEVLAAVRDRPVLTVTDEVQGAAPDSAIINFVVVDDKVRFDVSLAAANRAGLRISARLLTVARTVGEKAAS
jgi:hypothetical protein